MPPARQILAFLCVSLMLSVLIYRDAMWGRSLLAPLDIGPDLFRQYKFMDPSADGIPDNHHIIDQFTYDLPLQAAIFSAYRQKEIPWWDPYTYGGRPLLADAHINGTDPLRLLCYRLLPFELAYNWNYLLRSLFTGLGMFLLLSFLGVRFSAAAVLAIAYQFAGWYTLFFGHPWIQGSFVYFPYIWLLWLRGTKGTFAVNTALAGVACCMVFYSGNLQSHTYLPLFALSFLAAILIDDRKTFPKALGVCVLSGFIGFLLAFPVIANQVEFYLQSLRTVSPRAAWFSNLVSFPMVLFSLYPWSLGSFRTLDATKLIGGGGASYTLFFGAVGSFLALLGLLNCRRITGMSGLACRQAAILVLLYLLIIASPLSAIFYSRCAGLAGMGLTVLAGTAFQHLLDGRLIPSRTMVRFFAAFMVAVAMSSSCLAWFVYPRFKQTIERKLIREAAQSSYAAIPSIAKLRAYQINAFPQEVSLRNPEAALTTLTALVFAYALMSRNERASRDKLLLATLCLSILPVLMFHARFRPKHPIELWQRMLAGGDAQQQAIQMARGGLRLDEMNLPLSDMVFPNAMGALYRIHCVAGYSALQPPSILLYPGNAPPLAEEWRADLQGSASGITTTSPLVKSKPSSRFRSSIDGRPADVSILNETFNVLTLDVSRHNAADPLIRTDTYYPGWHTVPDAPFEKFAPCFSKIGPLPSNSNGTLTLQYSPSTSRFYGLAIGVGAGSILILIWLHLLYHRKPRVADS